MFITEFDKVWKEEVPEVVCSKKRRGRAAQEEEQKLYPHHKFSFAPLGKEKRNVETIFDHKHAALVGSSRISLSYFTRPNTTTQTLDVFGSPKERIMAKEQIAQKR